MVLTDSVKSHYEAVLQDLDSQIHEVKQQIAPLQAKLKELHYSRNILFKLANPEGFPPSTPNASFHPASQKYANMSVRWAILDLLNDKPAMTTAEIADALMAAGVQTRAANFANNVSAVLSTTMKERHNEVTQVADGKWELTDRGRDAIAYIKTTPKFRRAFWSSTQSLL